MICYKNIKIPIKAINMRNNPSFKTMTKFRNSDILTDLFFKKNPLYGYSIKYYTIGKIQFMKRQKPLSPRQPKKRFRNSETDIRKSTDKDFALGRRYISEGNIRD